jgi:hypothetical protein
MGWFETARRATMADRISEGVPATTTAIAGGTGPGSGQRSRPADVDDDDDQLAAYNAYLARINNPASHNSETSE